MSESRTRGWLRHHAAAHRAGEPRPLAGYLGAMGLAAATFAGVAVSDWMQYACAALERAASGD